jgi:hypothetical protein
LVMRTDEKDKAMQVVASNNIQLLGESDFVR